MVDFVSPSWFEDCELWQMAHVEFIAFCTHLPTVNSTNLKNMMLQNYNKNLTKLQSNDIPQMTLIKRTFPVSSTHVHRAEKNWKLPKFKVVM